ncbi:MAG: RsmF rRNA methyltransferase first C-terminal domain-containing protein [Clostridia bacterium]|nr:RsmF rRNA methyltransferase first C-terminal domain-containing protein [Clostridia bacterium]
MEWPTLFSERMRRLGGDAYSEWLWQSDTPRRGLRINTLKCPRDRFLSIFPKALAPAPFAKNSFYITDDHKAGLDPLHHAGAYYMQEPSACSAVTVLAPQPGEHILDLCAAPGGKSTQIAAALQQTGLLWCNEYVRARAAMLLENLERMGVQNAVVSSIDTTRLCDRLAGCFDAVLADVPCSGEGMFCKEPQALTQWSPDLVAECAARGHEILQNAAAAVRPGGRIVYSTCTFAPEENEGQIARFLNEHPDFTLCDSGVTFGRPGFSADVIQPFVPDISCSGHLLERCRRLFPADGGEGHFVALLQKCGDEPRREAPFFPPPILCDVARLIDALLDDCFLTKPTGRLALFGDTVRLLPVEMIDPSSLPVLAAGVAVGTIAKNRIEPHHALFAACPPSKARRTLALSLQDDRTRCFLHGEEITADGDNGFTLVAIEGVPCSFGKVSGGKLKNRYPKGLRLLK